MKLMGFAWLLTGWLIVVASLLLLPEGVARIVFFIAGFALEVLGLCFTVRAHIEHRSEREQ